LSVGVSCGRCSTAEAMLYIGCVINLGPISMRITKDISHLDLGHARPMAYDPPDRFKLNEAVSTGRRFRDELAKGQRTSAARTALRLAHFSMRWDDASLHHSISFEIHGARCD
jgi:hypothetical protein